VNGWHVTDNDEPGPEVVRGHLGDVGLAMSCFADGAIFMPSGLPAVAQGTTSPESDREVFAREDSEWKIS